MDLCDQCNKLRDCRRFVHYVNGSKIEFVYCYEHAEAFLLLAKPVDRFAGMFDR